MDREYEKHLEKQMHEQFALQAADYMIEDDMSIRQIAANMCLPATRVYKYLINQLKHIDYNKYRKCREIMKLHRWNRAGHIW